MSCYRPLQAWMRPGGGRPLFGKPSGLADRYVELPCGSCIGCFLMRAQMWRTRIIHESMCWPVSNLMVTLQYSDAKLPRSLSLEYRDFQLFLKRLRFKLEGVSSLPDGRRPIRFFVAGEYGGKSHRPHWHAVLFNTAFSDCRWWTRKGLRVGHSEELEGLWSNGYAEVAPLNAGTASYVAGYVVKKAQRRSVDAVDPRTGELWERRPEFQRQSIDPGLGAFWYARFGADLFPLDAAVVDGKRYKVPRYYWEKFQVAAPVDVVEGVRAKRIERAALQPEEESSLERLAVREEVAEREYYSRKERGL